MTYDCKVYDKNGNLKKILKKNEDFSKVTNNFLNQKSTKRAISYLKKMKEPKAATGAKVNFYDKQCCVCKMVFHPRHKYSIYCSYECQNKLYRGKKNMRKKIRLINAGKNF
jgi:hypothetical protein